MTKIISIHVPKTAGTSFRKTLESVYGRRNVYQVYDHSKVFKTIPTNVKVVHGHIQPVELDTLLEYNPTWKDAQVITWVRNPASRFISDYYYMIKVAKTQLGYFSLTPNLRDRILSSLDDFTNKFSELNGLSKFIDQEMISSERFSFIGHVENYESDLKRLAFVLGWKKYSHVVINKTPDKKNVDQELLEKIESLHKMDFQLLEKINIWNKKQIEKQIEQMADYKPAIKFIKNPTSIKEKLRPYLPLVLQ